MCLPRCAAPLETVAQRGDDMIFEANPDEELVTGRTYLVLLRRLIARSQTLTDELVRPHGLTGPQFLTLLLIGNNAGLTQADLTRLIESDPNTVSDLVRRLASRGLVARSPHPKDRRATQLQLTEAGTVLARAGLNDMNRLSRHLARTMPKRHAKVISDWLLSIISLRELPADA